MRWQFVQWGLNPTHLSPLKCEWVSLSGANFFTWDSLKDKLLWPNWEFHFRIRLSHLPTTPFINIDEPPLPFSIGERGSWNPTLALYDRMYFWLLWNESVFSGTQFGHAMVSFDSLEGQNAILWKDWLSREMTEMLVKCRELFCW